MDWFYAVEIEAESLNHNRIASKLDSYICDRDESLLTQGNVEVKFRGAREFVDFSEERDHIGNVCKILRECNAWISATCGLHIHVLKGKQRSTGYIDEIQVSSKENCKIYKNIYWLVWTYFDLLFPFTVFGEDDGKLVTRSDEYREFTNPIYSDGASYKKYDAINNYRRKSLHFEYRFPDGNMSESHITAISEIFLEITKFAEKMMTNPTEKMLDEVGRKECLPFDEAKEKFLNLFGEYLSDETVKIVRKYVIPEIKNYEEYNIALSSNFFEEKERNLRAGVRLKNTLNECKTIDELIKYAIRIEEDKNLRSCCRCEEVHHMEYMYYTNYEIYCENCHSELFGYGAICDICGEYYDSSEIVYLEHYSMDICDECLEAYFDECAFCDEYYKKKDLISVINNGDEEEICSECYDRKGFGKCEECFDNFNRENLFEVNGRILCEDCRDEVESEVR